MSVLRYTPLLDKHILAQNRHFALLFAYTQKYNHVNVYQVFGVVAGDSLFIRSVYANIDTKYYFDTSDICFA